MIEQNLSLEEKLDYSSCLKVLWKRMPLIVLQNLLSAVVSTAEMMLIHAHQAALSAASPAGNWTFVLTLSCFGRSRCVQYRGKGVRF